MFQDTIAGSRKKWSKSAISIFDPVLNCLHGVKYRLWYIKMFVLFISIIIPSISNFDIIQRKYSNFKMKSLYFTSTHKKFKTIIWIWNFVCDIFEVKGIFWTYFDIMKLNIYNVIQLWIFIYIYDTVPLLWPYIVQKLKWFMTCLIHQTLSILNIKNIISFIPVINNCVPLKCNKSFWISTILYIPNDKDLK